MVFVVRNDLKMGKGKVAAQVNSWAHEGCSVYTMSCIRSCSFDVLVRTCGYWSLQANDASQFGGTLPVYMTHSQ